MTDARTTRPPRRLQARLVLALAAVFLPVTILVLLSHLGNLTDRPVAAAIALGALAAGFVALLFIVRRLTQPLSSLVAAARAEHAEADFAAAAADVQEIAAAIEALNSAVRERDERLQAQTRVLEAQAREAEEELRAAGKATTEFIGVMSHELRTPITTIYGGARLLQNRRKSLEEGAAEELIASIEEEAERLFRLVENLLALARSDLGEEIVPDVLPVGPLVEQAVRQFSSRRPGRPLEVNAAPGLPLVLAEPGYVHQVLHNLITNADKYSDAGRPIEVAIEADANEVTIRVLDRGAGVAEAELDQIFDSFFRSQSTARQAGGKGLGLTVCKRLVEAMSGRIWASRRDGGGLEVGFALPAATEVATDLESLAP